MNKITFILILSLFLLASCEEKFPEAPGNIAGMGETEGILEVREEFRLPIGISMIGEIRGVDSQAIKSTKSINVNDSKAGIFEVGSGNLVKLSFVLVNTGEEPKTIYFPKGLLWRSTSTAYQHALTLQTAWISLDPNSRKTVLLYAYCINSGVPNPDQFATYKIIGTTGSRVMWNLLNRIGWKRINYEMIYGYIPNIPHTNNGPDYQDIADRLQAIVWNLTNYGISITAEDDVFIEGIPELYSSEIPPIDIDGDFPEYFEEFLVPAKK